MNRKLATMGIGLLALAATVAACSSNHTPPSGINGPQGTATAPPELEQNICRLKTQFGLTDWTQLKDYVIPSNFQEYDLQASFDLCGQTYGGTTVP